MMRPIPSDLEIAQSTKLRPIAEIARQLGISPEEFEFYGKDIGKIDLKILNRLKDRPNGKFITVTGVNPTPLGEGKTVTTIGLGQGMAKIGKKVINTLRQPSMGPTFGIKGGAAGGGYSQMLPMEEINLGFTGDITAVEMAHNLFNAAMDASILHGNAHELDVNSISLRRCVDLNDRALRDVVVGLGGSPNGIPRQTGYDITVATETAAILALATSLKDLRERIGRMVCGFSRSGKPVTAEDLGVAGAMTALLRNAIKPNLVQSTENHPIICHGFPFANVAHGNNSVIADQVGLKLADYVITESGFGADMGGEKLINIVCRQSGLKLDALVITCSVRALKMHGGAYDFRPGMEYGQVREKAEKENLPALVKGFENLKVHIENMHKFGLPIVVTINRFLADTDREINALVQMVESETNVVRCVPIEAWSKGGNGCIQAAEAIVEACKRPNHFHLLYPDEFTLKQKIKVICKEIYRADAVDYLPVAERKVKQFTELGWDKMPICMAKTHLSLSPDPNLKNVPHGFRVIVRDIRASVGAGFIYPLLGEIMTMPGLGSKPSFQKININPSGKIMGLF